MIMLMEAVSLLAGVAIAIVIVAGPAKPHFKRTKAQGETPSAMPACGGGAACDFPHLRGGVRNVFVDPPRSRFFSRRILNSRLGREVRDEANYAQPDCVRVRDCGAASRLRAGDLSSHPRCRTEKVGDGSG